jgi:hypothetical protein
MIIKKVKAQYLKEEEIGKEKDSVDYFAHTLFDFENPEIAIISCESETFGEIDFFVFLVKDIDNSWLEIDYSFQKECDEGLALISGRTDIGCGSIEEALSIIKHMTDIEFDSFVKIGLGTVEVETEEGNIISYDLDEFLEKENKREHKEQVISDISFRLVM